jgi:hypothetical protein
MSKTRMRSVTTDASKDVGGREIKEVRKILGEYPVIDSTADMVVYVNLQDQEFGVPGDPHNCMFSRACKRAFGSHGVLFYPTVAYVDMLNPKDQNERVVFRFQLPKETRERLERFEWDRSHAVEASFLLKAVSKSNRLTARRASQRKRDGELKDGKRAVDPRRSAAAKEGARRRREEQRLLGIRSGTSQVGRVNVEV